MAIERNWKDLCPPKTDNWQILWKTLISGIYRSYHSELTLLFKVNWLAFQDTAQEMGMLPANTILLLLDKTTKETKILTIIQTQKAWPIRGKTDWIGGFFLSYFTLSPSLTRTARQIKFILDRLSVYQPMTKIFVSSEQRVSGHWLDPTWPQGQESVWDQSTERWSTCRTWRNQTENSRDTAVLAILGQMRSGRVLPIKKGTVT